MSNPKTTRAHTDTRDATIRRYLLLELARFGLSGQQWDVLAVIMEDTYGWADKSRGDSRGRLDRNQFRYEEIAEKLDKPYPSVARAMRSLMNSNIIFEHLAPCKGRPGVYGINSDPATWVREKSSPKAKRAPSSESFLIQNDSSNRIRKKTISLIQIDQSLDPNGSVIRSKLIRKDPEKRLNQAVRDTPNVITNVITNITPIVPKGTESDLTVEITTPKQAVEHSGLTVEQAVVNAEREYTRRFGRPFSPRERMFASEYFALSRYHGSLLAIWLNCLVIAHIDRQDRKADPELARYVPKSPFKDVYQLATDEYANRKAKADVDQVTFRPPEVQRDHSERLEAAS